MLTDLKRSGLGPQHAKLLQLEPHTEGHKLDIHHKWAGYKIPYFTPEGKTNGFYRFRLLQYQPSTGWGAITEAPAKPLRYLQPKDSEVNIYLPPLGGSSWRKVMSEPSIPVCITEGEKKAAAATLMGVMPTIGLGGVYNWQSKRLKQPFLPILEEFNWKERHVYICYDSDADKNPMVRIACAQLSHALLQRGAKMHTVSLPSADGGRKQGLDDYLVANGIGATTELLDGAKQDEASEDLHAMNTEFAFVRKTVEVVSLASIGDVYPVDKFVNAVYKNRKYPSYQEDSKGNTRITMKYTAKEWVEWPLRLTVGEFVYEPGKSTIVEDNYNSWPGWGCTPTSKGSIQPWEDLISLLSKAAKPEHIMWLKRWFAYPLRHPGAKLATAVIMWGAEQGTGKTLLGDTMRRIYGRNFRAVSNTDLVSPFNEWVKERQFIVGDEISITDKRTLTDSLKDIITREQAVINVKYRPQYVIRDCANYYFTSNHHDAFIIEDADRRYYVQEVTTSPNSQAFYQRYIKWLDEEGGAARLFHHLLYELDMGDFTAKDRAPVSEAKVQMIMDSKSELAMWCARLRQDPNSVLRDVVSGVPCVLPYEVWTTGDLLSVVNRGAGAAGKKEVTTSYLARELKRAGFRYLHNGNNTGTLADGQRHRFWALRNAERFERMRISDVAKYYETERANAKQPKYVKQKEKVN